MPETLIPFDLDVAIREPERVRHVKDSTWRVKWIAKLPDNFFAIRDNTGSKAIWRDTGDFRLTAKTRELEVLAGKGLQVVYAAQHDKAFWPAPLDLPISYRTTDGTVHRGGKAFVEVEEP